MPESDPFAILGFPLTFELDPSQIERAYLARVSGVHPDLGEGDEEGSEVSAGLNLARVTLLNPESRATALLERLGYTSQDKSLPDGFLMEIMEVRMDLESAFTEGDSEQITRWQRWAEERRREWIKKIGGLFRKFGDTNDKEVLGEIRRSLNAWRYIERMIEQASAEGR